MNERSALEIAIAMMKDKNRPAWLRAEIAFQLMQRLAPK